MQAGNVGTCGHRRPLRLHSSGASSVQLSGKGYVMKHLFYSLSAGLIGLTLAGSAQAAFDIKHAGAVDPTAEGFTVEACCGQSASGSVLNDLGHDAWSITGRERSYQFGYYSGALSPTQKADIGSQGFVLTLEARASQGVAPVYDSS